MKRKRQGHYVSVSTAGEVVRAFVPAPLPPRPPIEWGPALRRRFDNAMLAIGRLDALTDLVPDLSLLLYSFVRKEAVLSSMIEGTQSSLADLMLYEVDEQPGVPLEDVREVSLHVAALEHGLKRLRGGFPLSMRLLREVHEVLLRHGRGARHSSGQFRRSQNWIGGTRPGNAAFVPPPPNELPECLSRLERFLHDDPEPVSPLIKAALAHIQFETIHPFLDGNGRVGRLLITLQLCADGVLRQPLLYLSSYFKTHRQTYYELLNRVRETGDWEAWLDFFADAVLTSATEGADTAKRLLDLTAADRSRIETIGRAASSALVIHQALQRRPVTTAAALGKATGISPATVNKSLAHLERLRMVSELTRRKRGRVFSYAAYAKILNEGTELPASGGAPVASTVRKTAPAAARKAKIAPVVKSRNT
jgi:Fic family protein